MEFLILISTVLINYQIYKFSKLYVIKDEQERDFGVPVVEAGAKVSDEEIIKAYQDLMRVKNEEKTN